jgi:hypothetical protein
MPQRLIAYPSAKSHEKYGWNLDRFEEEGDILFKYMLQDFDNMFDGKNKIKHFDIISGVNDLRTYVCHIKKQYRKDIERDLIQWIQKEFENNDLFQPTNWRPFREQFIFTSMFLGYRKMFQYNQYMFQLSLSDWCQDCCSCNYCKEDIDDKECIHFYLAFYGWKDDNNTKLQPYNHPDLSEENRLPESFWMYGNK